VGERAVKRRVEVSVNGVPAFDQYTTGFDQTIQVHARAYCRGEWCVIHRPMPGPWADWPTYWDHFDKVMYRVCEHDFAHPVAEMYGPFQVYHECECPWCQCHPVDPNVIDGEIVVRELTGE